MKNLKYFFLLVFIQLGFAQRSLSAEDIISGEVTVNNQPENNFKIFLFHSKKQPINALLKFDSKGSSNLFKIVLSPTEIESYKYLEIATLHGAKIFKISSLSKNKLLKKSSEDAININFKYQKIRPDTLRKEVILEKPAIYLYPEKEMKIDISHHFKGEITTTYPNYNNGWSLRVKPDGEIFNLGDSKTYNYLFWEGSMKFSKEHFNYKNGFYVEKRNYVNFLQEKLQVLAFNNTEINDFIVYWLPEMNKYENVFIHFWINDNIDNCSVLEVKPQPDTSIRVFMEFKNIKSSDNKLPEQILPILKRDGFTLVEWGGSEIISEKIK